MILIQFRKYATLVFITYQRFETSKRIMKDMNFEDIYFLASQILKHWTFESRSLEIDKTTLSNTDAGVDQLAIPTRAKDGEPVTVFDVHQISLNFMKVRDVKTVLFSDKSRLKEYISLILTQLSEDKAFSDDILERINVSYG